MTHQRTTWKRGEQLAWLAVLILAAILRMGWIGITEFKRDEANLSQLALDMAHGRAFPWLGITSSVGVPNPPISVYIFALPYLIDSSPVLATAFVGALNVIAVGLLMLLTRRYYGSLAALMAGVLYAASPWAVIFSRKIWAQDLLPPFVLLTIGTGLLGLIEKKRWAQWLHLPLLAFTVQIHFGAIVLIPISAWLLFAGVRRQTITRAVVGSVIIAGLLVAPYVIGLSRAGLIAPSQLQRLMTANTDRPRTLSLTGEAIHQAALTIAGTEIHSLAGSEAYRRYLAGVPDAYPIFNWIAWLALCSAIWLWIRVVRRGDTSPPKSSSPPAREGHLHSADSPSLNSERGRGGEVNQRAWLDVMCLIWFFGTPILYSITWTHVYPHYFIPMLPGAFAVIGIAVSDAWRAVMRPR